MTQNDIYMVYSTFASRAEALSAAGVLLEKQLIACGNIIDNVSSVYRWEGEIQQGMEAVLFAKTVKHRVDEVIATIKERHNYAVPCIVAYPVSAGHPPFLAWVVNEVSAS